MDAFQAGIIIQVTREVEADKLKCHRYWPDPSSEPPVRSEKYGFIQVTHVETVIRTFYSVRSFKVCAMSSSDVDPCLSGSPRLVPLTPVFAGEQMKRGSETRDVHQFAYEAWPDHGVPLTTREFLTFRAAIKVRA